MSTRKPTPKAQPLTPRQLRFIAEYLKDLNGAQAARRAGYTQNPRSARVQASQLLTKPNIRAVLAKRTEDALRRADMTAQDVLTALRRIVKADIRQLFDEFGNVRPIHLLSVDDAAQIAGYEIILKNAKAGDGKTDEVLKVKLEGRAKFVEMAARYFGLLQDHVAVSGDDELIALLKSARERGKKADVDDD